MGAAGVSLDDHLLAHTALYHLPEEHKTTRTVMITSAKASDMVLTLSSVLSQINELVRDGSAATPKNSTSAFSAKNTGNYKRVTNYERCLNGKHNPKTAHPESECFQLHPEK
ncbi:hypothetical protein CROQUDRAFT_101928 [Cronartium quercuum f. sp. fusiforme G11]|uniref:Uncharacterized protein n=1 Tax=Cronartium quercuum f. sp. fusiforme G11 TaxID=708437 RepID=A0A9P6N862_9BASI|nr:hypothetical protein CROQUDRAFT_101928 [Cronartium quercuum f. sp. fusiforme G11]